VIIFCYIGIPYEQALVAQNSVREMVAFILKEKMDFNPSSSIT
jgi:hypothetical protein